MELRTDEEIVSFVVKRATNPAPLSLTGYCVNKATTILLENREVSALLKRCYSSGQFVERSLICQKEEWLLLQTKVLESIKELEIPCTLKERILDNLWPLASNKLRWMIAYAKNWDWEHLQEFTWTDRGRIDGPKTAKTIIRNGFVPIEQRFELTCVYFLVDESRELWRQMSQDQKSSFFGEEANPIVQFFLPIVQETSGAEWNSLQYEDIFQNKLPWEAFKYCEDDKKLFLIGYFEFLSETLESSLFYEDSLYCLLDEDSLLCLFVLSKLDDETKTLLFYTYPALLLCCFVDYLSTKEFKTFFRRHVNELDQEHIRKLFMFLFFKLHVGRTNYLRGARLFVDLWLMIPNRNKDDLREIGYGTFWGSLLIKHHFPLVLREGGHFEMERFLSKKLESKTCERMLTFKRDMWCVLDNLIGRGLITVRKMKTHKIGLLRLFDLRKTDEHEWNSVIKFIHETSKKCSSWRKKQKTGQR